MEIWLDTSKLKTIKTAHEMGLLHGVTTNPKILSDSTLSSKNLLLQILKIHKGPVTVQVISTEAAEIIKESLKIRKASKRFIVKIPVSKEGLKAIHYLNLRKVPVMATVIYSATQAINAINAGATYLAIYIGRMIDENIDYLKTVRIIQKYINNYALNAKIIGASLRSIEHFLDCIDLNVAAVTLNENIFNQMIEDHLSTIRDVKIFSELQNDPIYH